MTNDELRKMLEFVAQRQEVFAENMDKAEKRMNQLESGFVSLFNLVGETAKLQKESAESNEARFKELFEAQKHTDERLSALINVVERFISNGRGGGNSSPRS